MLRSTRLKPKSESFASSRCSNCSPIIDIKWNGFMALQRRNNHHLVCHYCGRRSNIHQDGTVKQWECTNCEAMNYLDENGEVADPPTADTSSYRSTNQIQYAHAPRQPGPPRPQPTPEEPLFCSTCLRNQSLFTTSLAQYLPDDSDPDYELLYKNYYKFRRNLEKRYPQICTECEPRVTARMQQAGYVAKTDCLKRMLDKSKKRRLPGPSYKFSWASLFDFCGLLLWTSGLLIQVLWNFLGCFGSQTATTLASLVSESGSSVALPFFKSTLTLSPSVLHFCSFALPYFYSASGVPSSAKSSLVMSAVSIWWNPEWKNSVRGFNGHISGYQDWYKMQALCIMFRFLFWAFMKNFVSNSDASVVKAAHSFLLIITLITSFIAYRSINVDHSRIFVHTPEKLKRYVQPKQKDEDAVKPADIFARRDNTPRRQQPLFSRLTPSPPGKRNIDFNVRPPKLDGFINELNSNRSALPPQKAFNPAPSRSFSDNLPMSQGSANASPRVVQDRNQLSALENSLQPNLPVRANRNVQQQNQQSPDGSGMDWEPINSSPSPIPPPIPRAFQRPPTDRNNGFGQAPTAPTGEGKGPFWYRVPPAPRSLNAKLRNPITPGFTTTSEKAKENFFQSMSGSRKNIFDDNDSGNEVEFAQQKFFPFVPTDDGLSDLMSNSFSLKEKVENEVRREEEEKGRRWWHLLFVMVVVLFGVGYVWWSTPEYEVLVRQIYSLRSGMNLGGEGNGGGDMDGRKWDSEFRG